MNDSAVAREPALSGDAEPREHLQLLSSDLVITLAHEHLAGLPNVSIAPVILPRKARRAREAHALHLREDEPILVLFDGTLLGGGEDGFVATPWQICWRNFLEHPRRVRWSDLSETTIGARGRNLEIAGGQVPMPWSGAPERVRAFLLACLARAQVSATPYRQPLRERDARTLDQAIIQKVRRALGELDWIHYRPSIPAKMLAAARIVHGKHLPPHEEILVLYDDTLFGSGNDGIVFTEQGILWRNFWGPAEAAAWREIDPELVFVDGDMLFLDRNLSHGGGHQIDLRMRPGVARSMAGALQEIARALR